MCQPVARSKFTQALGVLRVAGAENLHSGAHPEERLPPEKHRLEQEATHGIARVDDGRDARSRDAQDGPGLGDHFSGVCALPGQQVQFPREVTRAEPGNMATLAIMYVEDIYLSGEHDKEVVVRVAGSPKLLSDAGFSTLPYWFRTASWSSLSLG